jgi:hypothetical protein
MGALTDLNAASAHPPYSSWIIRNMAAVCFRDGSEIISAGISDMMIFDGMFEM